MNNKILMLSPFFSPNTGGVETFLDDLIKHLNKNNEGVDVISYKPLTTKISVPFVEKKSGNTIYRLPWLKFNLFYKLEKYQLAQLVYLSLGIGVFAFFYWLTGKVSKYRVIHCHGMAAGFVGYILSFFTNKRFVLNFHTNYRFSKENLVGKFIRIMCKRYDEILVLSNACKLNLIEIGIPENKISTYYNWIDEDVFKIINKESAREELGLDKESFYALFVGRFSKEKGIFDLLDSVPNINKNINLIIIGGGIGEDKVTAVTSVNKNTRYIGRKNSEELALYLNAADILVYAPVDEDYLGRVAISALNCGLPIMIPDKAFYGGVETKISLTIPNEIGVIFENNYQSFAKALNTLVESIGTNKFDRVSCRKYAQEIYGEDNNGKIFIETLNLGC